MVEKVFHRILIYDNFSKDIKFTLAMQV